VGIDLGDPTINTSGHHFAHATPFLEQFNFFKVAEKLKFGLN
jgi:hypothetical protein